MRWLEDNRLARVRALNVSLLRQEYS